MQFTLPEQSDWCDNMTLRSYNYAPVLPVKVSRPYFSTRPQARAKNLVSGDETRHRHGWVQRWHLLAPALLWEHWNPECFMKEIPPPRIGKDI